MRLCAVAVCVTGVVCPLCVQSDMTKAANHIDFTSVPYQGPALLKGQELLAAARETAKQEAAAGPSLQRGWYYSGQLDHMVVWEKGACALHRCRMCSCTHVAHTTCDVAACSQANSPTTVATRFTKRAADYTAPSQPWPRCAKHRRSDRPTGQPTDNNEPRVSQGTYAPGAPKEYMDAKMTNGKDGKFSTHLGLAGMPRRSGLNTDKTRSKASADPTAWGYHSLSNF